MDVRELPKLKCGCEQNKVEIIINGVKKIFRDHCKCREQELERDLEQSLKEQQRLKAMIVSIEKEVKLAYQKWSDLMPSDKRSMKAYWRDRIMKRLFNRLFDVVPF